MLELTSPVEHSGVPHVPLLPQPVKGHREVRGDAAGFVGSPSSIPSFGINLTAQADVVSGTAASHRISRRAFRHPDGC
ncbi:hypothetical protein [Phyllobacterium zundukense]|uniref:hypothetical protein n=1 Tax=Phyllobacterium zundukense TaxID=1867719 RepID=UPI001056B26C|nr:hypothetical protein [Phyllobacterium zundukense]